MSNRATANDVHIRRSMPAANPTICRELEAATIASDEISGVILGSSRAPLCQVPLVVKRFAGGRIPIPLARRLHIPWSVAESTNPQIERQGSQR